MRPPDSAVIVIKNSGIEVLGTEMLTTGLPETGTFVAEVLETDSLPVAQADNMTQQKKDAIASFLNSPPYALVVLH